MKNFVLTCLLLSLSTLTFAKVDTHDTNFRGKNYQQAKANQYQTNTQPHQSTDNNQHSNKQETGRAMISPEKVLFLRISLE